MKIRASLITVIACVAALCAAADSYSLEYPVKPVRLVVPFPPGGAPDTLGRMLGDKLGERWGQQVLVENRLGAGGNVAYGSVATSAPDGYTLLLATPGIVANVSLYQNVSYDPVRDFAPITVVAIGPHILVVNSSLPVASVKDLIALAKAKPGALTFGSAGSGTVLHLAGEIFKTLTGVNIVHVPYKGSMPAFTDLLGGRITLMFLEPTLALPQLKSGKLRALGVTSANRMPTLPAIPTLAEAGVPGFEIVTWFGLLAPNGTDREVVDKVNQGAVSILHAPDLQARMREQLGVELVGNTPEQFSAYIKSEVTKTAKIVSASGARAD